MKPHSALPLLLLPLAALVSAQSSSITVNVDVAAGRHAIDPRVYGLSFASGADLATLKVPVNRSGGNATTSHNWQVDATNRANDWYYESLADSSGTPAASDDAFVSDTKSGGAAPLVTLSMIGWVAKLGPNRAGLASYSIAKYGAQTGNDSNWFPDAGNGIRASDGAEITWNDPNDANVPADSTFQQGLVQHFVGRWGNAASGGVRYYILDNEHSIWQSTHRDVHPVGPTMDEIATKMIDYASKVKTADPGAKVLGPEEWGWSGYFWSGYDQQYGAAHGWSSFPDRAAHGNQDYMPWLLDQLHQYETSNGQRLLDVFTLHYYPQGGEFGDDVSTAMQQRRNRSTRSLWDPNYIDETWINDKVQLIPRMKAWVASHYPGTELGITEYNWGAEGHINGATTQADVLGIFGREGLNVGTRWTTPASSTPTFLAIKMYTNYDGTGGTFGNTSVAATGPNPDSTSVFAAQRTSDGALTIMAINKVTTATSATINLSNFTAAGTAQVYRLTSTNAITHLSDIALSGNALSTSLPAQSITLFVLPAASAPTLSVGDVSIAEGNSATVNANFVVTLSATSASTVTVAYSTTVGTAVAPGDYASTSGTLTFAPGDVSKTVAVPVSGDTAVEADETFMLNLSSPTNATVSDGMGVGTILNDDTVPSFLSTNDVSVAEGNSGTKNATFTVTLAPTSAQPVTVTYATANGTATAGSDYAATSGSLSFAPGTASQTISVSVTGDTTVEPDETFVVNLTNAVGATVSRAQGTATITNDDSAPAAGGPYYVSPTGSDSNACTFALPCRQIRKALTLVTPGATIFVADGSYLGFDVNGIHGTSAAPITIKAQGTGAQVTPTTDRSDNRDTIFVTSSSYVVIDGLRSSGANRAAVRVDQSPNVTIRNGVFGNNATWGIFTDFSDDLLLERNECFGSGTQHGIYVSNSGDRPVLRDNRSHDNAGGGIQLNADASQGGDGIITGALLERNVIYNNGTSGGAGINLDGVQDSIVRNNVLYNNHATGIANFQIDGAQGPKGMQILHNTIDMASDGRWALLITSAAGTNFVRNNILYNRNSARGGTSFGSAADVTSTDSDYNVMDRATPDDGGSVFTLAQWQSQGHEVHSFSATPAALWVNAAAADYHLASGSPAIDAAPAQANLTSDMDLNPRPWGASADIGADEAVAANFSTTAYVSGLTNPTSMHLAPDGRIFVSQQGGQLRVVKNGLLLSTPFVSLTVDSSGERGLLGAAFDPSFTTNQFIYVYYTVPGSPAHNRVSRLTANGDVAAAGSEVILLELTNLSGATNHNGGALHFGPDGKLYVSAGENANGPNAQTLTNLLGKILRINSDGTIPTDNPFYATATGTNRAIWALGLRNPYTFDFQAGTGRMFINDVGESTFEEIDDGIAGSNYGWPTTEGPTTNPSFRSPIYSYQHASGTPTGCAITGGAFYNPPSVQFPKDYAGKYFFADFCGNWVYLFDPAAGTATQFATGISSPVDVAVGSDGSLYYLARGNGTIYRVQNTPPTPPAPALSIADASVTEGDTGTTNAAFGVTLSPTASGTVTVHYATANGTAIAGTDYTATSGDLTFTAGQVSKTIKLPVIGNFIVDGTRTFAVNLSAAAGASVADGSATGTILDNDVAQPLQFSAATYSVGEGGGSATITVNRSGASTGSVTVNYSTSNGTATAGSDYTTASGILTFGAGVTSRTFSVPVLQDVLVESNETVSLTLSSPGAPGILGAQSTATLTITDDDVAQPLQFSAATYSVGEGGGSATITVNRTGASIGSVTVNYATSNGTATAASDYTAASGTLTFGAGVTSQTFSVAIAQDALVEGNETVNLTLTAPSAPGVLGAQAAAVLTITDDDSAPSGQAVVWTSLVGVSANGNNLTKMAATGWGNAGAVSSQTLASGDGLVEVTASEANRDRLVGLGNGDSNQNYTDIEFAFYLSGSGGLQVFESGTGRGIFGSYTTGDKLQVSVESGTVKYKKNGAVIYTSTLTPTYPLLVDTSLYTTNATVNSAMLSGNWSTGGSPPPPGTAVVWTSLVGVSANGNDLTKTAATGWGNAGAVSTQTLASGDGLVEVTASEANRDRLVGLGNGDSNQNYTDIEFAFYLSGSGGLQVFESGTGRGTFGSYTTGDKLQVSVESGTVKYKKNGAVIYTSTLTPTYPLLVDTSFYTTNATVNSAMLSGNWSTGGSPPPPGTAVVWTSLVGVSANGNDLTKTAATGWGNAGAVSTQTLASGDGLVEVTASEASRDRLVGLGNGDSSQNYTDIEFGFYLSGSGGLQVFESGTGRGTFGSYTTGDKLQVSVESGVVKYRKNGSVIYTSTVTPTYPLLVDTSLYTTNATVNAAMLSGNWSSGGSPPPPPAGAAVAWTSLVGVSANGNNLTKMASTGWGNAGAISTQTLASGDGLVEVTASEANRDRLVGLGNGDSNQNYTDIEFAFYLSGSGGLQVFESGTGRGTFGSYTTGDKLQVSMESGVVKYKKNGAVIYTSAVTPTYPLLVDTSLYTTGATLSAAVSGNWQ